MTDKKKTEPDEFSAEYVEKLLENSEYVAAYQLLLRRVRWLQQDLNGELLLLTDMGERLTHPTEEQQRVMQDMAAHLEDYPD